MSHAGAPEQSRRLEQRQTHDTGVTAFDVLDPRRRRALDRIGAGLAERLAAGDVALDRRRASARAKRTRETLSAQRERARPSRTATAVITRCVRPDRRPASRRRRRHRPACRGCGGRSPPSCRPRGSAPRPGRARCSACRAAASLAQRHALARRPAALRRRAPLRAPRHPRRHRAAAARAHADLAQQLPAARALRSQVTNVAGCHGSAGVAPTWLVAAARLSDRSRWAPGLTAAGRPASASCCSGACPSCPRT